MYYLKRIWYSPLFRRPLFRIYYKTRRFFWNVLPDVLVIGGSVWILMQIWEWCFWR